MNLANLYQIGQIITYNSKEYKINGKCSIVSDEQCLILNNVITFEELRVYPSELIKTLKR
jgi:hypothetical protein